MLLMSLSADAMFVTMKKHAEPSKEILPEEHIAGITCIPALTTAMYYRSHACFLYLLPMYGNYIQSKALTC